MKAFFLTSLILTSFQALADSYNCQIEVERKEIGSKVSYVIPPKKQLEVEVGESKSVIPHGPIFKWGYEISITDEEGFPPQRKFTLNILDLSDNIGENGDSLYLVSDSIEFYADKNQKVVEYSGTQKNFDLNQERSVNLKCQLNATPVLFDLDRSTPKDRLDIPTPVIPQGVFQASQE